MSFGRTIDLTAEMYLVLQYVLFFLRHKVFIFCTVGFSNFLRAAGVCCARHSLEVLPQYGVLGQHWRNASFQSALNTLAYNSGSNNSCSSNSMHVSGETNLNSE